MRKIFATAIFALIFAGCGGKPDASTLTHPKRKFAFPMYITVPGVAAGTGAIYRVNDSNVNDVSELETVLEGLDFPAGITVNTAGTIYYTERASLTTGRIMRYSPDGEEAPVEVFSGLSNPEGLTIDRANKMYVSERTLNRISRVFGGEEPRLETISENLTAPTAMTTDPGDNIVVAEPSANRVSMVIPDGTREDVLTDVSNPVFAGPGLVGNTFVLSNNLGAGNGKAILVPDTGSTSTYLGSLVNPKSFAWEDGTILYIAEGAPTRRVIKYSTVSGIRTKLVGLPFDPHTIAMTPLN